MKAISLLLLLMLVLPAATGCGSKASEGINRGKDMPISDPKGQEQREGKKDKA